MVLGDDDCYDIPVDGVFNAWQGDTDTMPLQSKEVAKRVPCKGRKIHRFVMQDGTSVGDASGFCRDGTSAASHGKRNAYKTKGGVGNVRIPGRDPTPNLLNIRTDCLLSEGLQPQARSGDQGWEAEDPPPEVLEEDGY